MQILAEAEDLPKTANIKTQLVSLWTAPGFRRHPAGRVRRLPGFLAADVARDCPPRRSPRSTRSNTAMIRFSMITYNLCGDHAAAVLHGDRRADEADGDPEPRVRLLLSDGGGQRRDDLRAGRHLLPGRGIPSRPQPRTPACCSTTWPGSRSWPRSACSSPRTCCSALAVYLDTGRRQPTPYSRAGSAISRVATGLAMAPAAAAAVFRTGPLAWDGAISFWLRVGAFVALHRGDVLRAALRPAPAGGRGRYTRGCSAVSVSPELRLRRPRDLPTRRRRASATSGSCSRSCPRSTPRSGSSSSLLARTMPPPRPDVDDRAEGRVLRGAPPDHPDRLRHPAPDRRRRRQSPTASSSTT